MKIYDNVFFSCSLTCVYEEYLSDEQSCDEDDLKKKENLEAFDFFL